MIARRTWASISLFRGSINILLRIQTIFNVQPQIIAFHKFQNMIYLWHDLWFNYLAFELEFIKMLNFNPTKHTLIFRNHPKIGGGGRLKIYVLRMLSILWNINLIRVYQLLKVSYKVCYCDRTWRQQLL